MADKIGQLVKVSRQFRAQVLAADKAASARLIGAWQQTSKALNAELAHILDLVAERTAAGTDVANLVYREARVTAFLDHTQEQIDRLSANALPKLETAQATTARLGADMAKAQLRIMGEVYRPHVSAVEQMVGNISEGSPLRELFAPLGTTTTKGVEKALVTGVSTGLNPKVVGKLINDELGLGLSRSLTIARTEMLRAYRGATVQSYRDSGVVSGYEWVSARDETTCEVCWAADGEQFDTYEDIDGHPNCRCTLVPIIPTYDELLGTTGLVDSAPNIPDKTAAFDALSEAEQLRIMGPGKLAAYNDGVPWSDFWQKTESAYGTSISTVPLKDITAASRAS